MIDIVRIFCPIEKEIMGAGTQLLTFITDIRRLFEKSAYFGRKAFAEESTAFAAAFRAVGLAVWVPTETFRRTGSKMFTFRTFSYCLCGIMVYDRAMPAHFS